MIKWQLSNATPLGDGRAPFAQVLQAMQESFCIKVPSPDKRYGWLWLTSLACGDAPPVGDGRAALAQVLQDAQHLLGDARDLPLVRAPALLHHLRQRPPLRKLLRRCTM